jgi:hypothetical protein
LAGPNESLRASGLAEELSAGPEPRRNTWYVLPHFVKSNAWNSGPSR